MKYRFESSAETMPRAKIAALQLKRLRQTVKNAYDNVPLHRKRMRKIGIEPGDIGSLDDARALFLEFGGWNSATSHANKV